MALGAIASPAEAAPFAYVAGSGITVIDTATNKLVATIPGTYRDIAVSPDGRNTPTRPAVGVFR
jgi:DNA-binding beta-propeller fold protein YncE